MSPMQEVRAWFASLVAGWDRFWFTPSAPHTYCMIRILGGGMLFYTHLVWSKDLIAFLGPESWIPRELSVAAHQGRPFCWSYLWYFDSPAMLWTAHLLELLVFAMLIAGWHSRIVSVLSFLITVSYCHRLEGALFGLDQVNAKIALYLMIGDCGAVYSVDHWRRNRQAGQGGQVVPSTSINVAVRLLQIHMCIIYLFGGISKMKGMMWWSGEAAWYAVAHHEYQSLDMTWLAHVPWLASLLTHATLYWEASYCFLVWPRQTRPIVLSIAVAVHSGIALFLGMITFGVAMLIGNLAFIPPVWTQAVVDWFRKQVASRQQLASSRAS